MDNEDECLIPLQDQRVFGAGIKRKRVAFVPAASSSNLVLPSTSANVGERYLSIVFPSNEATLSNVAKKKSAISENSGSDSGSGSGSNRVTEGDPQETWRNGFACQVCNLPVRDAASTGASSKPHQALIAHQVCLPHSPPPSHLDRNRQGLKYLSSYGWDPDSRLGLGAAGDGIRAPIKVKIKNDTLGLGVKRLKECNVAKRPPAKLQKLDAKQVRSQELGARKRGQRLQEMFYRHDDVERYLGDH